MSPHAGEFDLSRLSYPHPGKQNTALKRGRGWEEGGEFEIRKKFKKRPTS